MTLTRTRSHLADPNCVVTDNDYDAIVSAIMETSRGRWFLAEFARRNRHADTERLLAAIDCMRKTLESSKARQPYLVETNCFFSDSSIQSRTPLNSFRLGTSLPHNSTAASAAKDSFDFRTLHNAVS